MTIPFGDAMSKKQSRLSIESARELEAGHDLFQLPLTFDLTCALAIVGNLQLALRHPGNRGPCARIARQTADGIIDRIRDAGFEATAQLAELGYNPEHDS